MVELRTIRGRIGGPLLAGVAGLGLVQDFDDVVANLRGFYALVAPAPAWLDAGSLDPLWRGGLIVVICLSAAWAFWPSRHPRLRRSSDVWPEPPYLEGEAAARAVVPGALWRRHDALKANAAAAAQDGGDAAWHADLAAANADLPILDALLEALQRGVVVAIGTPPNAVASLAALIPREHWAVMTLLPGYVEAVGGGHGYRYLKFKRTASWRGWWLTATLRALWERQGTRAPGGKGRRNQ